MSFYDDCTDADFRASKSQELHKMTNQDEQPEEPTTAPVDDNKPEQQTEVSFCIVLDLEELA